MRTISSTALSIRVGQSAEVVGAPSIGRGGFSVIASTPFARGAYREREAQHCGDHDWPGTATLDVCAEKKAQRARHQAGGNRMALDQMDRTKITTRAFDFSIDRGQSVAKILQRLGALILVPGNLFFGRHGFNGAGSSLFGLACSGVPATIPARRLVAALCRASRPTMVSIARPI